MVSAAAAHPNGPLSCVINDFSILGVVPLLVLLHLVCLLDLYVGPVLNLVRRKRDLELKQRFHIVCAKA